MTLEQKREQLIAELVPVVQPDVDRIEALKISTSQHNYTKYMHLLTPYKRGLRLIVAKACINAGANAAGVAAALKALYT